MSWGPSHYSLPCEEQGLHSKLTEVFYEFSKVVIKRFEAFPNSGVCRVRRGTLNLGAFDVPEELSRHP